VAIQAPGQAPSVLRRPTLPEASRSITAAADITLKVLLVMAMIQVLIEPEWAHLDGKAPVARAIVFPLWALGLPILWTLTRRASAFPWLPDLLITLTCLVDVIGNKLDLYDSLPHFDDGVHLLNSVAVSVAYVVLTVPPRASSVAVANAALAAGLTASLAWELFEYVAFLARTTEWTTVYADTIGDLFLGLLGSLVAVIVTTTIRRSSPARSARLRRMSSAPPDGRDWSHRRAPSDG